MRVGLFIFLCVTASQSLTSAAEVADVAIPKDPEAVRRGAEVIANVCMSCHSLKYVKYGGLSQLGFSGKELDTLRNGKKLNAPLETEMDPEMLRESFGVVPPDLSLMAKAREGGPHYIYNLLIGFYQNADGNTDNHAFPGIKMPDVLNASDAKDPAQRAELETQALDAAAFLAWAADPQAAERHRLGYYVLAYLALLTILLFLSKNRIWARLH